MHTDRIMLTKSTGYEQADLMLQKIVERFESTFPARMVGYYVEGSYADQTAVETSDLDLTVVFDERLSHKDEAIAEKLLADLEANSALELDISLIDEVTLRQRGDTSFKLGTRLVFGQDIRGSIPLMPLSDWARNRMHAAYWLMINVFERPHPVRAPLGFPREDDPFYGYANRPFQLADGREILTTRNLVRITGWIATARIAHEAQAYVVRKRNCYSTYEHLIGDEWTDLLAQIEQRCRTDWRYRIPESGKERDDLRMILTRTLAYENHFLGVYRCYLLSELGSNHTGAQLIALNFLNQIPFDDPTVMKAVRALEAVHDVEVRSAAKRSIGNVT